MVLIVHKTLYCAVVSCLGYNMHSENRTYSRTDWHRYWVAPMLTLVLMLFGCTASRTTRQVLAPSLAPTSVLPVTATHRLENIRSASRPDTTQVIITVSGPVQPLVQRLSQPDRLMIDLPDTRLSPQWNRRRAPVSDGRLKTIQVTQSYPKRVQITLALQAIQDYHIAVQSAPHRVTVELRGTVTTVSSSTRAAKKSTPPDQSSKVIFSSSTLAQSPAHACHLH